MKRLSTSMLGKLCCSSSTFHSRWATSSISWTSSQRELSFQIRSPKMSGKKLMERSSKGSEKNGDEQRSRNLSLGQQTETGGSMFEWACFEVPLLITIKSAILEESARSQLMGSHRLDRLWSSRSGWRGKREPCFAAPMSFVASNMLRIIDLTVFPRLFTKKSWKGPRMRGSDLRTVLGWWSDKGRFQVNAIALRVGSLTLKGGKKR